MFYFITCGAPSISSMTRQFGLGSAPITAFIWVAASIFCLNTSALRSSLHVNREMISQQYHCSDAVDITLSMLNVTQYTDIGHSLEKTPLWKGQVLAV